MRTQTNTPTPSAPLQEAREWLAAAATRCRAMRWLGALFHVRVAQAIVADAVREQERIGRQAYSAEQADLEAAKMLEQAAHDGLAQCDMPAVAQAIRLIRRSARADHDIAEVARA